MMYTNISGFDMEVFDEIDFVSAFSLFHMASQRSQPTQIAALVKRQTLFGSKSAPIEYLSGNCLKFQTIVFSL